MARGPGEKAKIIQAAIVAHPDKGNTDLAAMLSAKHPELGGIKMQDVASQKQTLKKKAATDQGDTDGQTTSQPELPLSSSPTAAPVAPPPTAAQPVAPPDSWAAGLKPAAVIKTAPVAVMDDDREEDATPVGLVRQALEFVKFCGGFDVAFTTIDATETFIKACGSRKAAGELLGMLRAIKEGDE